MSPICLDIHVEVDYERVEKRSNNYDRNVSQSLVDLTSSLITRSFRRLVSRVLNAHLFDSSIIQLRLVWMEQGEGRGGGARPRGPDIAACLTACAAFIQVSVVLL